MFLRVKVYPCNKQESRALSFSEEKAHWQIPMNEVNIICDVTTKDGLYTHPPSTLLHNTFSGFVFILDILGFLAGAYNNGIL